MSTDIHRGPTGRRQPSGPPDREWVGGRLAAPFYVTAGTPYRPEIILWMELPEGLVVHHEVVDPAQAPPSFGETLRRAMATPMIGPPRTPPAVRVASKELAAEVRGVLPETPVTVGRTPELEALLEMMAESTAGGDGQEKESYFEGGRVGKATVAALFRAAKRLYDVAPWEVAGDSQVIRVDIPAYDIAGACLSIIGALGESLGLILFPSLEAFERFLDKMDRPRRAKKIDLGTSLLSLGFESGSDLPSSMRREALGHGWPVSDARGYPRVEHRDRDGYPRPLVERDLQVMTAIAEAVAEYFPRNRRLFEDGSDEPAIETLHAGDGIEVRLGFPYEDAEPFTLDPPRGGAGDSTRAPTRAGSPKVGRNEPCPCGSGRKYKKCCLAREQGGLPAEGAFGTGAVGTRPADADSGPPPVDPRELDEVLVDRLFRYARSRFPRSWVEAAKQAFRSPDPVPEFIGPWLLFHHLVEGKPVAEWFHEEWGDRLAPRDLSWLNAQRAAWLSIWEVIGVEPGRSVSLRDLLTEETRLVREQTASRDLRLRDAVLARVCDLEGTSILCGVHPRPLDPRGAAAVAARVRGRLRLQGRVPIDRLRPEEIGRYLIARWKEGIEAAEARAGSLPALQNTDGDPLLVTVDHYELDPASREEIGHRLEAAPEALDPPAPNDPEQVFVFSRPGNKAHQYWESTVIARLVLKERALKVETNSLNRADAMRGRITELLGDLVRFRIREHADPAATLKGSGAGGTGHGGKSSAGRSSRGRSGAGSSPGSSARGRPGDRATRSGTSSSLSAPDGIPDEELNRVVLEFKSRHYADWVDHPLPALQGATPRDAIRTRAGREQVVLLLKEMENLESGAPEGQRFDFGKIWRELGLES